LWTEVQRTKIHESTRTASARKLFSENGFGRCPLPIIGTGMVDQLTASTLSQQSL
jgi:hypothetical protein